MEQTDPVVTTPPNEALASAGGHEARTMPALPLAWLFPASSTSAARRYGIAMLLGVVGVGAALPFTMGSGSLVVTVPLLAVVVSGWYGGLGPAILTVIVGVAASLGVIALDGPTLGRADVVRVTLFVPVALFAGILSDAVRRALLVGRDLAATQQGLLQSVLTSERQWRALAESMPALVWTADASGTVNYCNRAFLDYLGTTAEALPRLDWTANVHPDDLGVVARRYEAALRTGQPAGAEIRMRRHDGAYRWFIGYLSPIHGASGEITGWVRTSFDIQEARDAQEAAERASQREAELRLRSEAREAYFRALFDSSSDAILVADADGHYIDANRAASALVGYARSELVGRHASELVAAEREWTEQEYQTFIESGTWRGELELRHRDGPVIPVEAAASTVALESGQIGISALRDVSERRRFEELRQGFLASVSHELRNVLTPILGNAELLSRYREFDAESVQQILDQARRLQRIISDLTDTASAQAGHFELTKSEVDLAELVRTVVESFRGRSELHRIVLSGDETPVHGIWDEGRLQQVFENLLSNAVKYSPAGGDIEVTIARLTDEVEVSVRDPGIGLAPEEMSTLFEPFTRSTEARGAGISGFGLGLHVVRLIVEAHGGTVTVRSEGAMRGTQFSVRLPYK